MMEDIPFDQIQAAAEAKIIETRDTLLADQKRVRREQLQLSALERDIERRLADCMATARFFQINITMPVDDEEVGHLQRRVRMYEMRLRASENEEERRAAIEQLNRYRHLLLELTARKEAEEASKVAAQDIMQLEGPKAVAEPQAAKNPKVRDLALDRLQAAGQKGQKAAEIRAFIEESYPVKLHDKTVGMTLYRLSQDRLVHRIGQTWFYGPQAGQQPPASTEDPGAPAPGITHDVFS